MSYKTPRCLPLLGFWAVTSLIAFSLAGEKMPWLTVHIALPAILCRRLGAWAAWWMRWIGSLLRRQQGWLAVVLLPVFFLSFFAALGSLLGPNPPFQGTAAGPAAGHQHISCSAS